MYAGHFAAALAIKARVPKAPSWILFTGVGLLDLLWGPFMALDIEQWHNGYVQIGWSHSLLMAGIWSLLFGGLFLQKGRLIALAAGCSVFSHWLLDWAVHARHLPLYPYSTRMFGMNLGQRAWDHGWWLELVVILVCSAYYLRQSRTNPAYGRHAWWAAGFVLTLHVLRGVLNQ